MATVTYTSLTTGNTTRLSWETLTTTNDTGFPVELGSFADRSVQIAGTFGAGGTCVIQGSNDGGTTWNTLGDAQGTALSLTAAGVEGIGPITEQIRPFISGGDGTTDLDVHIFVRSNK